MDCGRARLKAIVESFFVDEMRISHEIALEDRARLVRQRPISVKNVVLNQRGRFVLGPDLDKQTSMGKVIHERVVHYIKIVAGIGGSRSFRQIVQHGGVLGVWTLFDQVPYYVGCPTVWDIDLVAIGPIQACKPVIQDVVHRGPGFQQMSHVCIVGIIESEDERGGGSDVKIVGLPVTSAIPRELAILDQDMALPDIAFQDAVLIVVKIAVSDGPICSLGAKAGAVVSGYDVGPGKLHVLDGEVAAMEDPDSPVFGDFSVRFNVGAGFSDAADSQIILPEGANISFVDSGIDENGVAILRHLQRGARRGVFFTWTDMQSGGLQAEKGRDEQSGCQK